MRQQEEKFAHLLAFASDRLQALPGVTPDMLRVYVTQLSVGQKESIPQFSDHMAGIISESSFSQMFALLSRIGAWGFLNFYLLKCIADRYGDDEMKREVEAYGSEVDTFKSETKVKDYLRICRSAYGSLPERKPLIVKLEEKWEHYTLADVAEEEGYLAEEFHLEPYIFNLSNGGEGSVMLMWLIPASAIPLIKRAVMENGMKSATNICELIVDDQRFIFKVIQMEVLSLASAFSYILHFLIDVSYPHTSKCTVSDERTTDRYVDEKIDIYLSPHLQLYINVLFCHCRPGCEIKVHHCWW